MLHDAGFAWLIRVVIGRRPVRGTEAVVIAFHPVASEWARSFWKASRSPSLTVPDIVSAAAAFATAMST